MEQLDNPPNINYMCSRLDNIITTCTDGLKGLTPQHTTASRATKADSKDLCYCSKTGWSQHSLAERFRNQIKGCPVCDESKDETKTLDVADIRGPCGKTDCRIARDMRYYIEDLAEEDNMIVDLNELVGPCGKTSCNFVKYLKDFIFHRGVFAYNDNTDNPKGCCCTEQMEKALIRKGSCESICSHDCENLDSIFCGGPGCVNKKETTPKSSKTNTSSSQPTKKETPSTKKSPANATESQNVQNMYYLTVKMDDKTPSNPESKPSSPSKSESQLKYCAPTCPKSDASRKCTKSACDIAESAEKPLSGSQSLKCIDTRCPDKESDKQEAYTPSPADSDVEINLSELRNPCNVKSCDVADKVVRYIVKGLAVKQKCTKDEDDTCFCDCSRCKTNT